MVYTLEFYKTLEIFLFGLQTGMGLSQILSRWVTFVQSALGLEEFLEGFGKITVAWRVGGGGMCGLASQYCLAADLWACPLLFFVF